MNKEIKNDLRNTTIGHIMEDKLSRRDFLKLSVVGLEGIFLGACNVDTAGDPTQNPIPNTEISPLPNMDSTEPNPDKFSTKKILAGIDTMKGIDATELEKFKSRAELAAKKIGLNLSDPLYETGLFGIKLQDGSGGEINHLFVSRSLKDNAPVPTAGPSSNRADEAGLFFLVDVDYPYFVAPGQGKGDAVMFPVVGYETDNGFALGLGTPNPDGKTYTSTFGFCEIKINDETNKAEGVTYIDPFSGNYKNYNPENVPIELEKMYTKVLPMPIAQKEPAATPEAKLLQELVLDPAKTETVSMNYQGIDITTTIATDPALEPTVNKIGIINSEFAKTELTRSTAEVFYKVWLAKGGKEGKGIAPKDRPSFETYMQMLVEAQNGDRPWSDMQIVIKADKRATDKYEPEKIIVWPWYKGSEIPPVGVFTMNNFVINFTNFENAQHTIMLEESDASSGVSIWSNNILSITYGVNGLISSNGVVANFLACSRNVLESGIVRYDLESRIDKNLITLE
jgi:hypothetical protein